MRMGLREYARHRKVTLRAVQKAIESGRIVLDENKKIDAVQADKDWVLNTDVSRVGMTETASPPAAQDLFSSVASPAGGDGYKSGADDDLPRSDDLEAYRKSRAAREHFNALMQEAEWKKIDGQLIEKKWACDAAFTMVRALRDACFNLPARIKDQLSVMKNPDQVEEFLTAELTVAFSSIDPNKLFAGEEEAG
jgi:hypothetical protein